MFLPAIHSNVDNRKSFYPVLLRMLSAVSFNFVCMEIRRQEEFRGGNFNDPGYTVQTFLGLSCRRIFAVIYRCNEFALSSMITTRLHAANISKKSGRFCS